MFPSASNLGYDWDSKPSNTDWLSNQSFQVPVETIADDDEAKRLKDQKPTTVNISEDSASDSGDTDIELIGEVQVESDKSKKKKKKKKKSRDASKKVKKDKHSKHRSEERERTEWGPKKSKEKKADSYINKVFLEEVGLPPEKAFQQDPRPDRNNLAFESVYNLLVPSYDKKKCFKSKRLRQTLNKAKQRSTRYFDSKMVQDENCEAITVTKKDEIFILPEYLQISEPAFKVISKDSHNLGDSLKDVHDQATALYIKAQDPKKNLHVSSEDEFRLSSSQWTVQNKTKEFNEYLRLHPNDIERWFKFLQFQEDSFIWSSSSKCTKSRETVLAEKKLSIVDKALEFNPKCMRLKLERLNLMRFIATPNELDKEWKKMTFNHPNNPTIWKNYFIFLQTHISHFSVPKLNRAFLKCFEIFNSMLEGTFQTHQMTENLETEIVKTMFHYTTFLSQAGYQEKAIAIWQVLIEFNLFTPEFLTYDQPLSEWKAILEPFWDSGCSRFGELDAKGWKNVMKNKLLNQGPSRKPIDELEDPLLEKYFNNQAKLWVEIETLREKYYWLPVKGPDADQADDTERNVLIDDLAKILFRFREDGTKYLLILHFLKFLGAIDASDIMDSIFLIDDSLIINPIQSLFNLRLNAFDDDFTTFRDQVFIQSIAQFKETPHEKQLILWRLKFLIGQVDVTLKYKGVKKIIKDYLKIEIYRNDLDLWDLLTTLEVKRGEHKEACLIYETAIDLFTGRIDSRRLFKFVSNYCQLLFDVKDLCSQNLSYEGSSWRETENQALKMISSVTLGKKLENYAPIFALKASKILDIMAEIVDEFTSNILFCHLLVYLIVNDSSLAFDECEALLRANDQSKSRKLDLFTIHLQLLIIDIKRTIKSISSLRDVCKRALEQFPNHKPFLSLFINIESSIAIPIAVDRFFTDLIRKSESSDLVIWIFKLHFELKRLNIIKDSSAGSQACDGIIRRINGLFERCLSFPCNQGIIVLWRTFMKFNADHGNMKKAESIVYRAIQNCPWSKILFLDAIDTFPHLLTDLLTIMSEKEIRLRAPIEEIDLLLKGRSVEADNSDQQQSMDAEPA
ncbi:protein NRDE2 homolog [Tetranychus urticae]|uniref:protein NRDE2 homolog n=1 Tax=Tetranychus urticae TaxID=32264 RepID=UPI00077BE23D|nr:protein NRDE2 homolog [Tetranychus urticae]